MLNDIKAYLAAGMAFCAIWVTIGDTSRSWLVASFFGIAYWIVNQMIRRL